MRIPYPVLRIRWHSWPRPQRRRELLLVGDMSRDVPLLEECTSSLFTFVDSLPRSTDTTTQGPNA